MLPIDAGLYLCDGDRGVLDMQVKLNLDGIGDLVERGIVRHSKIPAVERKISVHVLIAALLRMQGNRDGNRLGDAA